jgi:hypothetical protein
MTTPRGCLRRLTATLMRLARRGNVEGIRAYLRSDAFLADFTGLDPGRRQSAMRCYGKAATMCEAKATHPLVQPRPIDAKRTQKVNWRDPALRAKLANAYAQAGGDDEKAARILGVTLGSARLAKRRHLGAGANRHRQKAVAAAGAAICVEGTPTRHHLMIASVTRCAAFLDHPISAGRVRCSVLHADLCQRLARHQLDLAQADERQGEVRAMKSRLNILSRGEHRKTLAHGDAGKAHRVSSVLKNGRGGDLRTLIASLSADRGEEKDQVIETGE